MAYNAFGHHFNYGLPYNYTEPFKFNDFPPEVRHLIWKYCSTNNGRGRLVECKWEGTPYYQRATRRRDTARRPETAGVRWKYRLYEYTRPLQTLSVSREARTETIRNNPHYLQLNRGPKIYFNGQIDIVYFDLEDNLHMYKYCQNMIERVGRLMNVKGFDKIIHLGKSRDHGYRCLAHLALDPAFGPLIPNVQNVFYRNKPTRIANTWHLDLRLGLAYDRVVMDLEDHAQQNIVRDDRWQTVLLCGRIFAVWDG